MPNTIRPGFRLYPRGFVGGLPAERTLKVGKPAPLTVTTHPTIIEQLRPVTPGAHPNPAIEALYASLMKQSGDVNSFGFRAKVLSVALAAFGTDDVRQWIDEQYTTTACGELHRRFIHDMLRFVQGERREQSLDVWAALLDTDDDGIQSSADPFVDKFFQWYPEAVQLTNFIQMWCKRPGGINDLLVTLHLLFGDF